MNDVNNEHACAHTLRHGGIYLVMWALESVPGLKPQLWGSGGLGTVPQPL